jgi:hypothetical protein
MVMKIIITIEIYYWSTRMFKKFNKKKLISTIALLLSSQVASVSAAEFMDGKLTIGGAASQSWQTAIEPSGSLADPSLAEADSGFHRLRVALHITAQVAEDVSVFIELSEEPDDFGTNGFAMAQDLAWIQFDNVIGGNTLRVGNVVTTVQNFLHFSDGAVVQNNPLIGNAATDLITAENGIWLLGAEELGEGRKWTWDLAVTIPSFSSDFSADSGYNLQARTTYGITESISLGAAVMKTTGEATCTTPTSCTLTDGGSFNSIIGLGDGDAYEFATGGPVDHKHPQIIPSVNALLAQIDIEYQTDTVLVNAFYGQAQDEYSWANGNVGGTFTETDAEMQWVGILGKLNLTEKTYLATRYTVTTNDTAGVSGDNKFDRIQIGAGYWYRDNVLIKAEYVRQNEGAGSGSQFTGNGDIDWDAFLIEASVSF